MSDNLNDTLSLLELSSVLGPGAPEPGMIDLLLIHPYQFHAKDAQNYELLPYPPLGLLMIASVAHQLGYKVVIADSTFAKSMDYLDQLLDLYPPRLVGTSAWSSYRSSAGLVISEIKKRGIPVMVGGPDPTIYPENYLNFGAAFVVLGEGEETIAEILQLLLTKNRSIPANIPFDQLSKIPGLVLSQTHQHTFIQTPQRFRLKNLDDLPIPRYDLIPTKLYTETWEKKFGYRSFPIMTARGCPFQCTWCARPVFGSKYIHRSVSHVLQEITYLVNTFGVTHFRIIDDTFGIKKSWVVEWAQAIQKSGLRFQYECLARVKLLTKEVVTELKRSGCIKIYCGVESGSDQVLKAMKKGNTTKDIQQARKNLKAAGIEMHAYMMFGYPGENHQDVRKTIRFLKKLLPDSFSISIAYPMKGTEFYEMVKQQTLPRHSHDDITGDNLQFQGLYSNLYYRIAKKITYLSQNPKNQSPLINKINTGLWEILFTFVYWRDSLLPLIKNS